jgi:hypothetical protein
MQESSSNSQYVQMAFLSSQEVAWIYSLADLEEEDAAWPATYTADAGTVRYG